MAKALIPLANGFEDVEAVAVIDVLRRGGVEVVTASVHGTTDVRSAHGISVRADVLFSDVEDGVYDAIVLPGGGEGAENFKTCVSLSRRLRKQNEEKRLLCAICAAPTVLTASGAVSPGVRVTCYPTCRADLDREWSPDPVVADGNIITGQAPGSAILFALVVLKTLMGEGVARGVACGMVTDVLG